MIFSLALFFSFLFGCIPPFPHSQKKNLNSKNGKTCFCFCACFCQRGQNKEEGEDKTMDVVVDVMRFAGGIVEGANYYYALFGQLRPELLWGIIGAASLVFVLVAWKTWKSFLQTVRAILIWLLQTVVSIALLMLAARFFLMSSPPPVPTPPPPPPPSAHGWAWRTQ
jgi:hypothetical protein